MSKYLPENVSWFRLPEYVKQIKDQLLTFLTDAPADNKTYGRKNNTWAEVTGGGGGGLTSYDVITGDTAIFDQDVWDLDLANLIGETDADTMDNYGFFIDIKLQKGTLPEGDQTWIFIQALTSGDLAAGEIDTAADDYGQPLFRGGIVLDAFKEMYVRIRIPKGGLRAAGVHWEVVWGLSDNYFLSDELATPLGVEKPNPGTPTASLPGTTTIAGDSWDTSEGFGIPGIGMTSTTLTADATKLRLVAAVEPYNTGGWLNIKKLVVTPFL